MLFCRPNGEAVVSSYEKPWLLSIFISVFDQIPFDGFNFGKRLDIFEPAILVSLSWDIHVLKCRVPVEGKFSSSRNSGTSEHMNSKLLLLA